jgi:hypothetical protein
MPHPFQIGKIYANRKGDYEVIRIDDAQNTMVIRYIHNGESYETTISDSERILENINLENTTVPSQPRAKRRTNSD